MSKRILILTDPYGKPSFGPRLRYMCDYLVRNGYEIRVITEEFEPIPFEHNYPITTIALYKNKYDWAIKSLRSLLFDWKNKIFTRKVRELIRDEEYDLVYCTTFSTFPLPTALAIAREKHIPLHVDIRDLDEQVPNAQYQSHRDWWTIFFRNWYKQTNITRRNAVLCQADSIATISPWHRAFLKHFNSNVHLIWNGYDPQVFYPDDIPSEKFLIGYFGKVYPFQHPELIEEIIRSMDNPEIQLDWHTPEHNPLPLGKVADGIRRCSILLVLTDPRAHGMMTTKFYEALGCEKPILCIPSDNGLLAEVIKATNAGLSSSDPEEIKSFILEQYAIWKKQRFTHQDIKMKESFSRETLARQTEQILISLME